MITPEQRRAVIAEATTWIGTPYHHMGRVKGAGVDCATFPFMVYAACGILHRDLEIPLYPLDWSRHQSQERYMEIVLKVADEIPEAEAGPGDLVLFRQGRTYSHGAIIVDWPTLIHSKFNLGVYGADATGGRFLRVPRKFFTMKDGAINVR